MYSLKIVVVLAACIAAIECTTCTTDADCTTDYATNSECNIDDPCTTGNCGCSSGYGYYNNTCGEVADVGSACSSGDSGECGDNAECTSDVCTCPTGFKASGDDCEANADLGEACSGNNACKAEFAECTSSTCSCQDDYSASGDDCRPNDRGEACSSDSDCFVYLGLTCQSSVCACSDSNDDQVTVSFGGVDFKGCYDASAERNLGSGESCKTDVYWSDSTHKSCKSGYDCSTCPEDSSTDICIESGSAMAVGSLMATILLPILAHLM